MSAGSAAYPQWGLEWTYDRYGNRTAQTVTAGSAPTNPLSVDVNTNRITSPGVPGSSYPLLFWLTPPPLWSIMPPLS